MKDTIWKQVWIQDINDPKVKIVNTSKLYLNLCKINKGRVGNEIYFLIKHGLTRSCCRELDTQTWELTNHGLIAATNKLIPINKLQIHLSTAVNFYFTSKPLLPVTRTQIKIFFIWIFHRMKQGQCEIFLMLCSHCDGDQLFRMQRFTDFNLICQDITLD